MESNKESTQPQEELPKKEEPNPNPKKINIIKY